MSSSQSAVWQRLPERSFKARSSNIVLVVKLMPNSLNSQGAALFLTALYYIVGHFAGKFGATLRAGVPAAGEC